MRRSLHVFLLFGLIVAVGELGASPPAVADGCSAEFPPISEEIRQTCRRSTAIMLGAGVIAAPSIREIKPTEFDGLIDAVLGANLISIQSAYNERPPEIGARMQIGLGPIVKPANSDQINGTAFTTVTLEVNPPSKCSGVDAAIDAVTNLETTAYALANGEMTLFPNVVRNSTDCTPVTARANGSVPFLDYMISRWDSGHLGLATNITWTSPGGTTWEYSDLYFEGFCTGTFPTPVAMCEAHQAQSGQ